MGEVTNMYPNLNEQTFRLNEINKIKDYVTAKTGERELMNKMLCKYIYSFGYFYKFLIVLSVTSGGVSIASFATVIGAPIEIARASFSFAFSRTTGIVKNY